jgi:hypothetical protein
MDRSSKVISSYINIWFAASTMNAVISSLIILSPLQHMDGTIIFLFFFICLFSLVLAIPVLALAMMISIFILLTGLWDNVFGIVLSVTFIVSIAGAFFFKDFLCIAGDTPIMLVTSIVLSAIAGVVLTKEKLTAINIAGE